MTKLIACCAALPIVLVGCASRPVPDPTLTSPNPRLISCSDPRLVNYPQKGQGVILEYTVSAEGRVDPLTIRERRNGIVNPSGNAVSTARQIAASCMYRPGTEAMTVRQYFSVDVGAEQRAETRVVGSTPSKPLPGQKTP